VLLLPQTIQLTKSIAVRLTVSANSTARHSDRQVKYVLQGALVGTDSGQYLICTFDGEVQLEVRLFIAN
jgi:hypothetical protein